MMFVSLTATLGGRARRILAAGTSARRRSVSATTRNAPGELEMSVGSGSPATRVSTYSPTKACGAATETESAQPIVDATAEMMHQSVRRARMFVLLGCSFG